MVAKEFAYWLKLDLAVLAKELAAADALLGSVWIIIAHEASDFFYHFPL